MHRLIVLLIALVLTLGAFVASASDVHRIVAVVDGIVITQYDLDLRMQQWKAQAIQQLGEERFKSPEVQAKVSEMRAKMLEQVIDDVLVDQQIKEHGLDVTKEQVDGLIEGIKQQQMLTDEDLQAQMDKMGVTLEEFRAQIKKDYQQRKLIRGQVGSKVVVTEEEIQEEFEKRMGLGGEGMSLHLAMILVASEDEAADLRNKVLDGDMTFAEAADERSVGAAVGNGGDIGSMARAGLAESWQTALDGLEPGGISEPFDSGEGWVILKLIGFEKPSMDEHAGMRDQIYDEIRTEKFQKLFEEYMKILRLKALIEYK